MGRRCGRDERLAGRIPAVVSGAALPQAGGTGDGMDGAGTGITAALQSGRGTAELAAVVHQIQPERKRADVPAGVSKHAGRGVSVVR